MAKVHGGWRKIDRWRRAVVFCTFVKQLIEIHKYAHICNTNLHRDVYLGLCEQVSTYKNPQQDGGIAGMTQRQAQNR